MTRTGLISLVLLLALPASAPRAFADDIESEKLFEEAKNHFNDPDPAKAVDLAMKALDAAWTREAQLNALVLLGRIHQVKTGDLKISRRCYELVIAHTIGLPESAHTKLLIKSKAFLGLGNIIYAERGKILDALSKFQAGHKTYPNAVSAEVVSQFMYRQGMHPKQKPSDKKKQLDVALKLSEESLKRLAGQSFPELRAKAQLQRCIVFWALGMDVKARLEFRKIVKKDLTTPSHYQLAVWHAHRGESATKLVERLTKFMKETRPTVQGRNQLRKFIKSEPSFRKLLKRKPFKRLLKKEKGIAKTWPFPKLKPPRKGQEPEKTVAKTKTEAKTEAKAEPKAVAQKTKTAAAPKPAAKTGPTASAVPDEPPAGGESWRMVFIGLAIALVVVMGLLRFKVHKSES